MSILSGNTDRVGAYGRIWPAPSRPKRKRFVAWFERGMDIRVKNFPTRRAAEIWLLQVMRMTR